MLRLLAAIIAFASATHAALAGAIISSPPTSVPEPISLSLLAAGVGGAVLYRRFRK